MSPAAEPADLLLRAAAGESAALDEVMPVVYGELRSLARRHLRNEHPDHTFSTTALVHEAYLRLVNQTRAGWNDRAHFLAVAAIAMRRILVDHARRHRREKHGGGMKRLSLEQVEIPAAERAELFVALDEALTRLALLDLRQARVVECRFFGGMTVEETAAALGIGVRTAKRDWEKARSWLYQEIHPDTIT